MKDVERELDAMLEAICADMDMTGDGKVSLEEAIIYLQSRQEDTLRRGDGGSGAGASTALSSSAIGAVLAQVQQGRQLIEDSSRLGEALFDDFCKVERAWRDSALGALDEDGDGKVSIEEAMKAPAKWWRWG